MNFHIKFRSLLVLCIFFSVQQSTTSFQLPRVQAPVEAMLKQQEQEIFKRMVTKYAVTAGLAATAAIVLFVAFEIREAAKKNRQAEYVLVPKDKVSEPTPPPSSSSLLAPLWMITGRVKSVARDSSDFMANSATMLASGMILNGASNYMQQKIAQVHQDETVLWYIAEHTNINHIFSDLKSNAIEYDLYATLLCAEAFNQDAQIHMRAFVKDLIQTTKDHNATGNSFYDDNYLDLLLVDVKKKYMRQSGELEALQGYVIPTIAKRHRAQASGQAEELFVQDINRRKDIAGLCEHLARDVEKLTAFMHIRFARKSEKVQQLIDSCNAYIESMEQLLNASPEKLAELSKADRGMFTCSYEYERVFNQQVSYMHRYCRMVE